MEKLTTEQSSTERIAKILWNGKTCGKTMEYSYLNQPTKALASSEYSLIKITQ